MLTAQTSSGKKICLGLDYKKETLLHLRNVEEFICPVCGERVTLKLGEHRIFHFAHRKGSDCRTFFENETIYHMDGKRQLYQWLTRQKIQSELEYYDKEIQQRPDIMFYYKGKRFALEYQCSSISESIFLKRTETYLQNGYIPIWVLGNKNIQQKKKNIVSLSNFHYLFIRASSYGTYYLPSYCPEKKLFHMLGSIHSYSAKNSLIINHFFNPNNLNVEGLLNPKLKNQLNVDLWYHELEYSYLNWSLHPSSAQQSFLREIYQHGLNPYLLSPLIGLPVQHSYLIQTTPIIWQTYFYLDHLAGKKAGDVIRLVEIERALNQRINRKEIIPRTLPQYPNKKPIHAVLEYVEQLLKFGLIIRLGSIYHLQHEFEFPKSNREKEETRKKFIEKNYYILTKA